MSLTDLSLKQKKSEKNFPIIEKSPRRVRVKLNHEFIADSTEPTLLVEYGRGKMPVYFFKKDDIKLEYLEPSDFRGKGNLFQFWNVQVGDRLVKNAAYSYSQIPEGYEILDGLITFKWNSMDNWYEEEEEIFLHPRDPFHRVDTIPSSRHIRIEVNGKSVVDTTSAIFLFETGLPTRYYIPQSDVKMNLLEPTEQTSYCPYKGTASYWSINVDNEVFKNIIWGYPSPIAEIPKIKGFLAFWVEKSEKIKLFIDGKAI